MRKLLFSFLIGILCVVQSASAMQDPATFHVISQQLEVARQQLRTAVDTVKEAKMTSGELYEMRAMMDEIYKEYEILSNFDPNEFRYMAEELKELTNLTKLKDADSWQEQYWLMHDEVSKRFKLPTVVQGSKTQKQMHGTVIEMQSVDQEIARVQAQLDALRKENKSDAAHIGTEASLLAARSDLERKKEKIEEKRKREAEYAGQLKWDSDFVLYLEGSDKKKNVETMDDNWVLAFIRHVLNPQYVYKAGTYLAGAADIFLILLIIFMAFRMLSEGFGTMRGRSSLPLAFMDALAAGKGWLIYITGGGLFFGLMFAVFEHFDAQTGAAYIHSELLDLRTTMVTAQSVDDFGLQVLGYVVDWANIFNAGFMILLYTVTSVVYVFAMRLIDVVFAVLITLAWALGFIAIASHVLPKKLDLTPGWIATLYGAFLWGICDGLLMAIAAGLTWGGGEWLKGYYGGVGVGVTATGMWSGFATLIMLIVVALRLVAPFIAMRLASQQSFLGAMGAMTTAMTVLAGKMALDRFAGGGTSPSPIPGTDQGRGLFGVNSLSNGMDQLRKIGNTPLKDLDKAMNNKVQNHFAQKGAQNGTPSRESPQLTPPEPMTPSPEPAGPRDFDSPFFGGGDDVQGRHDDLLQFGQAMTSEPVAEIPVTEVDTQAFDHAYQAGASAQGIDHAA